MTRTRFSRKYRIILYFFFNCQERSVTPDDLREIGRQKSPSERNSLSNERNSLRWLLKNFKSSFSVQNFLRVARVTKIFYVMIFLKCKVLIYIQKVFNIPFGKVSVYFLQSFQFTIILMISLHESFSTHRKIFLKSY